MLNPQQQKFKEAYLNPESETFGNALQSGLAAGYSQEYSESIGNQGYAWYSEMLGELKRRGMLGKAERNLNRILETDWGQKEDKATETMRIVGDISFKIAKTLGKDVGYAERNEVTGKDGKDLPIPIMGGVSQTKEE